MAIQTFTSGQTLTAAQMTTLQQNDYNWSTSAQTASYVLVAADAGKTVTMTNAGATTITVNTSLFTAGDTVRIINLGAGACTITAGTATVNTAGSLVLPQYGSGTLWFSSASAAIFIPDDRTVSAGLTLISTTTIGSAVSSVTVSNCFSATYDNYKIIVNGGAGSGDSNIGLTLGASATAYYSGGAIWQYPNTQTSAGDNNATSWTRAATMTTNAISADITLLQPFAAARTSFNCWVMWNTTTTNNYGGLQAGFHNVATSYTSFTLTPATGTMTGGTIRVYGYQNS